MAAIQEHLREIEDVIEQMRREGHLEDFEQQICTSAMQGYIHRMRQRAEDMEA